MGIVLLLLEHCPENQMSNVLSVVSELFEIYIFCQAKVEEMMATLDTYEFIEDDNPIIMAAKQQQQREASASLSINKSPRVKKVFDLSWYELV